MASTVAAAKGPSPPELTGFWSTMIADHLATAAPTLDPAASYLVSHGIGHLLLPLLEAYLLIKFMQFAAAKMSRWCERNWEARPLLTEVLEVLPGALKGPTVATIGVLITLRLAHNAVYLLGNYMYKFETIGKYGPVADAVFNNLVGSLRPMGKSLVTIYSLIMLFYLITVLVKWKSVGLTALLEREREQQEALIAASGGKASKSRTADDLERLLVPFDAATSWLMYAVGFVAAAQVIGVDIAPLVAVGGAGSIIIGLATQQLLTNAFMGLSLFFTRPFVDGDSVLVQAAGGLTVSGVVEKTTIMRTVMRTDDDVVVTIPNKTVADMIVYNRSAEVRRSRLASANRQTENIKLRLRLPYAQEAQLRELQELVKAVLEPPRGGGGSGSSSAAVTVSLDAAATATGSVDEPSPGGSLADSSRASPAPAAARSGKSGSSPFGLGLKSLVKPRGGSGASRSSSPLKITHPVVPGSVEVVISRFTDSGLELLVKAKLRLEPGHSMVQSLLLDLSRQVRQLGGMMVNV